MQTEEFNLKKLRKKNAKIECWTWDIQVDTQNTRHQDNTIDLLNYEIKDIENCFSNVVTSLTQENYTKVSSGS